MTQAELNKKAVQSIFAIDDAKAQLESFGSQLDLGLPPEEDYEPKGFDDLMTVNPSAESNFGDTSERFADLGDDLQDEQTQKFVVDKFIELAAKRPGSTINMDDITGICNGVQCSRLAQGGNLITGDLVGFIKDTIAKAKNTQQSQNVSDAQPNGTVADDISPCSDNAEVPAEDPNALGGGPAPVMEPIEPSVEPAEPALEPNADDPLALDDGLGALDTSIGEDTAPLDGLDGLDGSAEPAPTEGGKLDAGGLDGLDDLDKDLGDIEADDDLGLDNEDSAPVEPADGESNDDAPKDKDEPKDNDEPKSEDAPKDKDEPKDDDFDFESVAKKAKALTEGEIDNTDTDTAATNSEENAVTESIPDGEGTVTEEAGAEATETPTEECGGVANKPVVQEGTEFDAESAEAKVESIAKQFRTDRIAEKVQAQIEAYEAKEKKSKTAAQIESVMKKFVKSENAREEAARVESIVAKFGKASKAAAAKAKMESAVARSDAQFKSKLGNILESIDMKKRNETRFQNKLNRILESAKAATAEKPKIDSVGKTFAMIESAIANMNEKEASTKAQLESIVDDASKRTEGDNLQKELDAIVESVRKA